jgi:hypothetical protein
MNKTAITCAVCGAVAIWLVAEPVKLFLGRMCLLLALAGFVGALMVLLWKWKLARWGTGVMLAVAVVFIVLPGTDANSKWLQAAYVHELQRYDGVKYVWGGENWRGVDCSGLVRVALISANLRQGLWEMNSKLVREGILLWWSDCTARELGNGYRQRTRFVERALSLNQLDHSILKPGDLAVTAGGAHVLAYLGERRWIEADPGCKKVVIETAPAQSNAWFNMPVQIVRWSQLES